MRERLLRFSNFMCNVLYGDKLILFDKHDIGKDDHVKMDYAKTKSINEAEKRHLTRAHTRAR